MQEHSETKRCPGCDEWKPWSEFYRNRSTRDGYQAYCKPCWRVRNETSKQRHRDARLATKRATEQRRREEHPDYHRAAGRRWYASKGQDYYKRYRTDPEHREAVRAAVRKYRAKHVEEQRIDTNNRRARKDGAPGEITLAEWQALCERHQQRCACCKQSRRLEIDHIVPMKLGGSNWIANIQPLCHGCNTRKRQQQTDYRKSG